LLRSEAPLLMLLPPVILVGDEDEGVEVEELEDD
jgi:hypothetical protein